MTSMSLNETTPNIVTPKRKRLLDDDADTCADSAIDMDGTTPSPPPPPKKIRELYTIPEINERYVAKTSTAEGIESTNPSKFCLKPAFWKTWTSRDYATFATELREQFDPIPFARKRGLPAEEVRTVFTALVCNPLYDAGEAQRRGEEGMQEIFDLYNKYGTANRRWGHPQPDGRSVYGEVTGVEEGKVVLALRKNGSKHTMKLEELTEEDVEYLGKTLSERDLRVLNTGTKA